jgi:hypothetical protein
MSDSDLEMHLQRVFNAYSDRKLYMGTGQVGGIHPHLP